MEQYDYIQKFGYSEMYEWKLPIPEDRFARFVTFDNEYTNKLVPFGEGTNDKVFGVTTINAVTESDNPDHWQFAYLCNEIGDTYLKKEKLAVGQKIYDEVLELNYIMTRPWEHYIPILNEKYDESIQYVPRVNRNEWIRVNLLGKCIVRDNGKCKPGEYCQPYDGKLKKNFGIAIPAKKTWKGQTFYILGRISKNTIMILMK